LEIPATTSISEPPECYEIPQKTTLVKAGAITGDKVVVNFKNLDKLDATRRYVLPVAVTNITNIDLLESSRNVYFRRSRSYDLQIVRLTSRIS